METSILTSAQVEAYFQAMKATHRKNSAYRMENYFNCVDDYSWGGICDQVQDAKERQMALVLDAMREQEQNGGFVIVQESTLELRTIDGEFVSDRIIDGKYGRCFMFGSESTGFQFVGLAKKQSTYANKGFQVVTITHQLKVVYTGRLTSKGNAQRTVELMSKTESVDKVIDCSVDNKSYNLFILNNSMA